MGSLLACVVAFVYSVGILRLRLHAPLPIAAPAQPDFDFVVTDAFVIAAFVGLSRVLAQALALPRPYWVPVSCLAVIQGASLRAVWSRLLHRVISTALGMLLASTQLSLPLGAWTVCLAVTALCFIKALFSLSIDAPATRKPRRSLALIIRHPRD